MITRQILRLLRRYEWKYEGVYVGQPDLHIKINTDRPMHIEIEGIGTITVGPIQRFRINRQIRKNQAKMLRHRVRNQCAGKK